MFERKTDSALPPHRGTPPQQGIAEPPEYYSFLFTAAASGALECNLEPNEESIRHLNLLSPNRLSLFSPTEGPTERDSSPKDIADTSHPLTLFNKFAEQSACLSRREGEGTALFHATERYIR
jgi:hypothetical protein